MRARQIVTLFGTALLAAALMGGSSSSTSAGDEIRLGTPVLPAQHKAGPPATGSWRDPNCTCRAFGQNYSLGDYACIQGKVALCDKFLNNTSWTFIDRPCPTS
ncbi:MAG: hypothetical protein AB7L41_00530 [Flavobacteriaceae bacterium]